MVKNTETVFRPPSSNFCSRCWRKIGSTQVLAVWQWWNWLLQFEEIEKPLLVVNWDETACRLHYPTGKGLCLRRASPLSKRLRQPTQSVSMPRKRASLTHVALICNDETLQPALPQIVIGNEHMLTTNELTAIGECGLPPNMHVWRLKSAWVNKDTMREILYELWTPIPSVHTSAFFGRTTSACWECDQEAP